MIQQGSGEALVLLHGVTSSCKAWKNVIPTLSQSYTVYAFTALGHRGTAPLTGKIEIRDVIDDIERQLDQHQLDKPHIVGNSMGGWVAIELAKRGRAQSVCALSPAGCWDNKRNEQRYALSKLKRIAMIAKLTQAIIPFLAHSASVRKLALRDIAEHGDRLSVTEFLCMVGDILGCEAKEHLLNTTQRLDYTHPLPCPVTLAWPEKDRLFPIHSTAKLAQQLLPDARFQVLKGLGHVPMIDDAKAVIEIIIDSINNARNAT
ncbi:alpha/beta fold hydrolase [Pseudoalteromonas rhizosphaerae]|uniref:alpha/beta fold hydrolase n=1 Tax=Pseudoalteromonas rhizosphaerae TaxID=2518973 RepID=UPI0021472D1D|nr:alpha/beta hydrolase [Pseudoalteromonas rhizosphaerae]